MSILNKLFFPVNYVYEQTYGKRTYFIDESNNIIYIDASHLSLINYLQGPPEWRVYSSYSLQEKALELREVIEKVQKQEIKWALKSEEEKLLKNKGFAFRSLVNMSNLITFTPSKNVQETSLNESKKTLVTTTKDMIKGGSIPNYYYSISNKHTKQISQQESHVGLPIRGIFQDINDLCSVNNTKAIDPCLPSQLLSPKKKFLESRQTDAKINKNRIDQWNAKNRQNQFQNLTKDEINAEVDKLASDQLNLKALQGALLTAGAVGLVTAAVIKYRST